jgi:hypothetical protein
MQAITFTVSVMLLRGRGPSNSGGALQLRLARTVVEGHGESWRQCRRVILAYGDDY